MRVNNKFLIHKSILCNTFKNVMEVFSIKKIVLNFGVKNAVQVPKRVLSAGLALNFITSNKVLPRISTKSVMVLKVREGMVVGCKSTLRKNLLVNFINLLFEKLLLKGFEGRCSQKDLMRSSKDFTFSVEDLFIFKSLEFFFDIFSELPHLNITLIYNRDVLLFDQICFLRLNGLKLALSK